MKAIEWQDNKVIILDQTRLPREEVYLELSDHQSIASAIAELKIRGAPAIGVCVGYGMALGALKIEATSKGEFLTRLRGVRQTLAATRPTARNLFQTIERMERVAEAGADVARIKEALVNEAIKIHAGEVESTRKLSQLGAELIKDGATVLTHCNTGPLATTGYGTALGVIMQAWAQGKRINVFVVCALGCGFRP